MENGIYRRTVSHEGEHGIVAVAHAPDRNALMATIRFPCVRALQAIVTRVRHVFDVGADVDTITSHLAKDTTLAPLIASRPGLRTPGCWDGFELAIRAVLGQQITVEAARQLGSKLVLLCGDPVRHGADPRLTRTFPSARCLATADLSAIGMPESRRATVKALAQAAVANPRLFDGQVRLVRLARLKTTSLNCARSAASESGPLNNCPARAAEPDAFPATDIGILRGAAASMACCSPHHN